MFLLNVLIPLVLIIGYFALDSFLNSEAGKNFRWLGWIVIIILFFIVVAILNPS